MVRWEGLLLSWISALPEEPPLRWVPAPLPQGHRQCLGRTRGEKGAGMCPTPEIGHHQSRCWLLWVVASWHLPPPLASVDAPHSPLANTEASICSESLLTAMVPHSLRRHQSFMLRMLNYHLWWRKLTLCTLSVTMYSKWSQLIYHVLYHYYVPTNCCCCQTSFRTTAPCIKHEGVASSFLPFVGSLKQTTSYGPCWLLASEWDRSMVHNLRLIFFFHWKAINFVEPFTVA